MTERSTFVRLVLLTLGVAAVAFPTTAAAKADPCAQDDRLVNTWNRSFTEHVRITGRQQTILQQIFTLLSTNQTIPRELVTELRALVTRNRQVLTTAERRMTATKAGTANGRVFKRLALRYIRLVSRPMNECIAKLLNAESAAQVGEVGPCSQSANRMGITLGRQLTAALTKMQNDKQCAGRPPRP